MIPKKIIGPNMTPIVHASKFCQPNSQIKKIATAKVKIIIAILINSFLLRWLKFTSCKRKKSSITLRRLPYNKFVAFTGPVVHNCA